MHPSRSKNTQKETQHWHSYSDLWRKALLIAIPFGALAFLLGWAFEYPSNQATSFDLIAYPVMAVVMIGLEIILALRRASLRFVVLTIIIGASSFFLAKLCFLLFGSTDLLQKQRNFTETFYWVPVIYLLSFLVPGFVSGRVVATAFTSLFLLVSLIYIGLFAIPTQAWGLVYALIQINLANGVQLALTYAFINFKEKYTQAQTYAETVEHFAYTDSLTKLPNRLSFNATLEHLLIHVQEQNKKLALFFIDLDNFKVVNDTLGHAAGDSLLLQVAERLKSVARQDDVLARISGDEFVLVMQGFDVPKQVDLLARRLQAALMIPFSVSGQSLTVTASIGVSLFPDHGQDALTLLRHADSAMYRVKHSGKNDVKHYEGGADAELEKSRILEKDLNVALAEEQFELHFQPLFDLKTGAIRKAETLLRWKHPEMGWISPSEFIPLAEETGFITQLGNWVLRSSCAHAKDWQRLGWAEVCVTVNISPLQFMQPNFYHEVVDALETSGLPPEGLELEITEGIMLHGSESVLGTLAKLRRLGVSIALDDFGTGYSSLAYLRDLPIDCIKIDRSFIRDLGTPFKAPQFALALVSTIVDLANYLDIKVVAEGIETSSQRDLLVDLGCHLGQGYYFAKPLPADGFRAVLFKESQTVLQPARVMVN
jgi:diguanylate cyclase